MSRISRRIRLIVAAIALVIGCSALIGDQATDASTPRTSASQLQHICNELSLLPVGFVQPVNPGSRPHTWSQAGECNGKWVIVMFSSDSARDAWVHANWGGLGANGTIREGAGWAAATWHTA